jgi:hypothetical protein
MTSKATIQPQETRSQEELLTDVFNRLAGIQNVLYAKSAPQTELHKVWKDVQTLAAALKDANVMLAGALSMSATMQQQRDEAIKAVQKNRAEWISFAEKQGRRVLAAGITLDRDGIDEAAVISALDFIAGAMRGDASEGAMQDVAAALEKLGKELNGKGM